MQRLRNVQERFAGNKAALLVVVVLVVGALATSGWLVYEQHNNSQVTPSRTSSSAAPTPTITRIFAVPSAARSNYTNTSYGYTVQYPTDWVPVVSADKSRVQIFIVRDKSVPQGMGFDIWCAANPSDMSAQQWRQSETPSNSGETAVGYVTLSSGTQAYKVVGHATGTYDVFTSVHGGKACDLTEYETDTTNTKVIAASINSFTWN